MDKSIKSHSIILYTAGVYDGGWCKWCWVLVLRLFPFFATLGFELLIVSPRTWCWLGCLFFFLPCSGWYICLKKKWAYDMAVLVRVDCHSWSFPNAEEFFTLFVALVSCPHSSVTARHVYNFASSSLNLFCKSGLSIWICVNLVMSHSVHCLWHSSMILPILFWYKLSLSVNIYCIP